MADKITFAKDVLKLAKQKQEFLEEFKGEPKFKKLLNIDRKDLEFIFDMVVEDDVNTYRICIITEGIIPELESYEIVEKLS